MKQIFVLLTLCLVANCLNAPEVKLNQGVLKGKFRKTWKGRKFAAFSGIPYAKPPVGDLRFKPPVPAESWKGILDATNYSPVCPQMGIFENDFVPKGDENCLYLNVYTPQGSSTKQEPNRMSLFELFANKISTLFRKIFLQTDSTPKLLPVMVFIHGGGFRSDSGDPILYGPDIIIDYDVILVTFNYRLGFLGFASTGSEVLPGNLGLKDQNLALKWIKNNIRNFGGDFNKITIFGQSAGGASVHLHTLSPSSKGLFNAAIAQSGISFALWSVLPSELTTNNTKRMARLLNCSDTLDEETLKCFNQYDPLELVEVENKLTEWDKHPMILFRPVIEPDVPGAFLTKHPIDLLMSGKIANVPFVTGFTANDGAMVSSSLYNNTKHIVDFNENFNKILPVMLQYKDSNASITEKIRQFYFENDNINSSNRNQLTNLFTDSLFVAPANLAVQLHAKYSKKPVYYYNFAFRGSESFTSIFGDADTDYGVCHCDDLLYLLSNNVFENYRPYEHRTIIDIMATLWTNVAKYGDPTPSLNEIIQVKWNPATHDLNYYLIKSDDEIFMSENEFIKRVNFWNSLPLSINKYVRVRDEL